MPWSRMSWAADFLCCIVLSRKSGLLSRKGISTLMNLESNASDFIHVFECEFLCLIVSTIIFVICHFKNIKVSILVVNIKTPSSKWFQPYFITNLFLKPFSSLLVYRNLYLTRTRNLIKRLSKTSGMNRLHLLRRLIPGLVRLNLLWQFSSGDLQFVRKYLS